MALACAALRFLEHKKSGNQQQRRHCRKYHCGSPAIRLCYRAAEEKTECATDRHAEHEQREHSRASGLWKQIAEPARRGRRASCFADPNAYSGKEQYRIGGGEACGSRHRGPYDDSPGQELFAAGRIRDAPEGHANNGIDPDEGAADEADLAVAEVELLAHGLDERTGDVAVVEIEDIDGEEHHHGEPETLLL